MINPAEIPQIPGDMAVLGQHAAAVTGLGTAFPDTGRRVHSTWQTLAPVYSAPESGQLFAATGPVQTVTASVGQDLTTVGGALSAYADEVAAIKARLEALRTQATDFVNTVGATEDWREDEGDVQRHNQMLSDVNAAVADFQDAQRRCANAILGLYSDMRYVADNGDGVVQPGEYGFTREMLDGALAQEGGLPWGAAEEHDRGFLGDVGAFFVGIKDGAVDMVTGLGALIGYADGEWSWATAGAAWKGLGTFALALSPIALGLNSFMDLPGLPRGTLQDTLLNAGKALIAYDTWGEDKSKAAGMVTFNVVSAVLGTKGAGAALRGGGTAAQASRVGLVAKAGGGAVRLGEAIGRMPTLGDLASKITSKLPGFRMPNVDIPNIDIPPNHVDVPSVEAPRAEVPPAGPSIGDAVGDGGRNALPPAATITPGGVVDGRVFDPPTSATPDGPPLVQDGVIGGGRGVDAPASPGVDAPPRPDAPGPTGLGDAVGDGARAIDTPGAASADPPLRPDGLGDAVGDGARNVAPPGGVIDQSIFDPPASAADAPPRADAPAVPGERSLPPAATLTPDGVLDGRIFDPSTPDGAARPPLVQDGVIGGGRGADAPNTDVPARPAETTPAPAGVDRGFEPRTATGRDAFDLRPGEAIDPDGVVRDVETGRPVDAPARTPEPEPALVGAGRGVEAAPARVGTPEPALVGGGRGVDAPVNAGTPARPIEVGAGGGRGGFDGPTAQHTPDAPFRGGGNDVPPARGIDTPAPSRGADVPARAGVPDQPIAGGGRGGAFDGPPVRPDVPAGGGRGGGFDTPARADVPDGRPDAPAASDAGNPADAPTGRNAADAPPARPQPDGLLRYGDAPDGPGRGDGPNGDGPASDRPDGDGSGGDGPDTDKPDTDGPEGDGTGGDGPGGDGPGGDGPGGDGPDGGGPPNDQDPDYPPGQDHGPSSDYNEPSPDADHPADRPFDDSDPRPQKQLEEPYGTPLGTLPRERLGFGPDNLINSVDGKPVRQFMEELSQKRTEMFREDRNTAFTRDEIKVSSLAIDLRTGRVFEGTNGIPDSVLRRDDLVKPIRDRYDDMRQNGSYANVDQRGTQLGPDPTRFHPHPDLPLRHAEVKAVNELAKLREAQLGRPLTVDELGEMRIYNYDPFAANKPRPCCANCTQLLDNTPSYAEKVEAFPPNSGKRRPH